MNSFEPKNLYNKIISFGFDSNTDKNELKKIKLFNVFCYTWYVIGFSLSLNHFLELSTIDAQILTHATFCSIIFIGQVLHFKKLYTLAHFTFIISLLATVFIFSNFVSPGQLTEFYYLMVAPISLIFINNRYLNYAVLLAALTGFILPNLIYGYYDDTIRFDSLIQPFLLISIFIIVNYFKLLNAQNETALESKKDELERINRFQSQFFINISHEIRTPITLIKGQIEEMKKFYSSEPELLKIEQGLNLHVNQIKSMVDDVLDSAKMKSSDFKLNLKQISITRLIKNIYISFETNFKLKNIAFELITSNKDYEIKADSAYLQRAINNLVVNALKYTDKEGRVSIELVGNENDLIISVSDSGIGISNEDIDKIYNQFYQVDNDINRSGGSGIGLSFTKEIIELHGAKLELTSRPNKGSKFEIIFPVKDCFLTKKGNYKSVIEKQSGTKVNSITKNEKCFLIVDDNREMRQYLANILKKYNCIEAGHGLEALEKLEQHKIDFVITDYMMPKMDGLDFVKKLKEKKYYIPVLMLTARTDKESRLNSFRLGIDDYLNKPFDRDELLVRIENALNNHLNRISYNDNENITSEEVEKTQEWVEKVERYIFQECSNLQFKQVDIAEHFNISESSLYRKIKSTRGKTPNQFITELKLQKARKIIENDPEVSLKKLSLDVGFKHNYYFSEIYFKRFGNKPWNEA